MAVIVKELLIYFFTLDHMDFVLFVPAVAIAFFAGVISLIRGVGKWT